MPSKTAENVTCDSLQSTSITCEWDEIPPGFINGILRGYRWKYRIYTDPGNLIGAHPWQSFNFTVSTRSGELTGLKQFTRYELMLYGFTNAGEGVGKWMQLKTKEGGKERTEIIN